MDLGIPQDQWKLPDDVVRKPFAGFLDPVMGPLEPVAKILIRGHTWAIDGEMGTITFD